MRTRIVVPTMLLSLLLAIGGLALASDGVSVPRRVLGGGASNAATAGVILRGTLGQPVVGLVTGESTDIALGQGFWLGGVLAGDHHIYLPVILRG